MAQQRSSPLRVLTFSSGNPDATFLAAGLLHGRPDKVSTVLVQGVGAARLTPEVRQVLEELSLDLHSWVPRLASTPPIEPVDVGVTVCVPT